jgi:hypothetical protein
LDVGAVVAGGDGDREVEIGDDVEPLAALGVAVDVTREPPTRVLCERAQIGILDVIAQDQPPERVGQLAQGVRMVASSRRASARRNSPAANNSSARSIAASKWRRNSS